MSKRTTLEDRLQIVSLAEVGWSDPQIAEQTGWSVHTVRKWRRRGQRQGRAGLASPMGRPAKGPLSTYPANIRHTLKTLRETTLRTVPKVGTYSVGDHGDSAGWGP